MAYNAPAVGEMLLLKYILNHTASTNKVVHLYKNDVDHTDDSLTISSLTEATEAGYAPVTLTGASWTVTNNSGVVTAEYAQIGFTFTTSVSVSGYYVTSTNASELLWLERFSGAPFTLPSGGGVINITPKASLD